MEKDLARVPFTVDFHQVTNLRAFLFTATKILYEMLISYDDCRFAAYRVIYAPDSHPRRFNSWPGGVSLISHLCYGCKTSAEAASFLHVAGAARGSSRRSTSAAPTGSPAARCGTPAVGPTPWCRPPRSAPNAQHFISSRASIPDELKHPFCFLGTCARARFALRVRSLARVGPGRRQGVETLRLNREDQAQSLPSAIDMCGGMQARPPPPRPSPAYRARAGLRRAS